MYLESGSNQSRKEVYTVPNAESFASLHTKWMRIRCFVCSEVGIEAQPLVESSKGEHLCVAGSPILHKTE